MEIYLILRYRLSTSFYLKELSFVRAWLRLGPSFLYFLEGRMTEGEYQRNLRVKIETRIPGVIVLKNDPTYLQGFPDLLLLKGDKWATLEVKKDEKAKHRPNQDTYIQKCKDMGAAYSSFIFPQNEKEILDELERAFES